jgi:hypothetical protein
MPAMSNLGPSRIDAQKCRRRDRLSARLLHSCIWPQSFEGKPGSLNLLCKTNTRSVL